LSSQIHLANPFVSNKHVRIYTIIFDQDSLQDIPPLVYAEDLSLNRTFWNDYRMDKGKGSFLLSDGDILRVSADIHIQFKSAGANKETRFTPLQELEMKVGIVMTDIIFDLSLLIRRSGISKALCHHAACAWLWGLWEGAHGLQRDHWTAICLQGCRSSSYQSRLSGKIQNSQGLGRRTKVEILYYQSAFEEHRQGRQSIPDRGTHS
jgi:hypothetical protein